MSLFNTLKNRKTNLPYLFPCWCPHQQVAQKFLPKILLASAPLPGGAGGGFTLPKIPVGEDTNRGVELIELIDTKTMRWMELDEFV
jgi:hypothetical protein